MNKNWLKRNLDELKEGGTGEGWNPQNKSTLEKFGETNETLTWNGEAVGSGGGASTIEEVEGLQEALDDKADLVQVNGLESALDGKADTLHGHTIEDVTNLQNALDDKADSTELHSHTNKGVLDELDDNNGTLTYLGSPIGGSGGASTFTELTDTPSTLGTDGQFLGLESDMYGQVSMKWKDFPTIPQELTDFSEWPNQNTATAGQMLSLSANMSGGNDLVWVDAPSGSGGSWEHGTFTPTLVNHNNNTPSSAEVVVAQGVYHKMGDMVVVSGRISWRNATSLDEQVRISGLPFDVESGWSATIGGIANTSMPTNDLVGDPATVVYGSLNDFSNQIWLISQGGKVIGASTTDSTIVGVSFSATYRIQVV